MARGRPVSIVFYAINGKGLGHLTRLLAVARMARQLLEALDVPADLEIVTTSEASSIADDFAVYKLPSKTAVARAGAARDRYAQRAKLIVSNLVAAQAPDLLVLDTVPYGAFQEFSFLRSYARSTAYLYRHLDPRSASSDLVQRHLDLFDRIVVPDDASRSSAYPMSRAARARASFVGGIHGFDASLAWDRTRVRAYFGVPAGRRLVYVAAGGGGDGRAGLEALVRAISGDPRNVALAGYGPLHRGPVVYAANVIPLFEGGVSRYFLGVDAAVSAAGFNSYEELLAARVPALFFAQAKGLDRQDLRIEAGLARRHHGSIPEHADAELVRGRLDDLLEGALGREVRGALAARAAPSGALRAAVELLAVCASQDGGALDRAALYEVAAWRRDLAPVAEPPFVASARAYLGWRALAAVKTEIAAERDEAAAAWWSDRPLAFDPVSAGAELIALRRQAGVEDDAWRALVRAFAAHAPSRAHRERLEELGAALRAAGPRAGEIARGHTGEALRQALLDLAREEDARADVN